MKEHHKSESLTHVEDGDIHAVTASLRVLITPSDEGGFVAQGLEIDYVATGETVEAVQNRFATGLLRTIEGLIRRNRPLSALFKSNTPPEAWQAYMDSQAQDELACAIVVDFRPKLPERSLFPFRSLTYCQMAEPSHA